MILKMFDVTTSLFEYLHEIQLSQIHQRLLSLFLKVILNYLVIY